MAYWNPLPDGLKPVERQLVGELRALKDAHRLTYRQLGCISHYSKASWERWLNGKRPVTREALEALSAGLGEDLGGLLRLLEAAGGAPPVESAAAAAAPAVPAQIEQLPFAHDDFAGRDEEVGVLVAALSGGRSRGRYLVVLDNARKPAEIRPLPPGALTVLSLLERFAGRLASGLVARLPPGRRRIARGDTTQAVEHLDRAAPLRSQVADLAGRTESLGR